MAKHTDIEGKGRTVKRMHKTNCKRCSLFLTVDNKWKDEALCLTCGRQVCKERDKKYAPKLRLSEKLWRERNPEKIAKYRRAEKERKIHYKRTYGLDCHEVDEMFSKGCEVCGSRNKLVIDHCHNTKKVRGCLCHGCNCAIGFIKDNPNTLRKLANYLELKRDKK